MPNFYNTLDRSTSGMGSLADLVIIPSNAHASIRASVPSNAEVLTGSADQTRINTLLASLGANQTCFIAPGTIVTTDVIDLPDGSERRIMGAGPNQTVIRRDNNTGPIIRMPATGSGSSNHSWRISGLKIIYNTQSGASDTAAYGIQLKNSNNAANIDTIFWHYYDDLVIEKAYYSIGNKSSDSNSRSNAVWGLYLDRVKMRFQYKSALYLVQTDGASSVGQPLIVLTNCYIWNQGVTPAANSPAIETQSCELKIYNLGCEFWRDRIIQAYGGQLCTVYNAHIENHEMHTNNSCIFEIDNAAALFEGCTLTPVIKTGISSAYSVVKHLGNSALLPHEYGVTFRHNRGSQDVTAGPAGTGYLYTPAAGSGPMLIEDWADTGGTKITISLAANSPKVFTPAREIEATYIWNATDLAKDAIFFTALRKLKVTGIIGRVTTVGSDGSPVTGTIRKVPSGTAIASGTALHSGTFNLKGTADTNQTLTLSTTLTDLELAAGDSLAFDLGGTATAAVGSITVMMTSNGTT